MRPRFFTIVVLFLMEMPVFVSSATAQVDTKIAQSFNIRGTGWRKVLRSGTPVTVFAYKHKGDVYSFGIYSDDYAGIIDLNIFPFEVEEKPLKKLPDAQGKKASQELMNYYEKACARAREKAFAGKYKTTSPDMFVSGWGDIPFQRMNPLLLLDIKKRKTMSGLPNIWRL